MAHNGTSQGQLHLVDEHGNRVDQIEGNATQGTAMGFAPVGAGTHDDAMKKEHEHHHDEGQQQLHRSGGSSSSSSEDDGEGGRRKKNKGIKEKIKEALTGDTTHDDKKELGDQQLPPQTTTIPTPETEGEEKKE
ncbi:abscisic acid and environmental stress-inducible protein TAS14-like [Lycium ferocissimum]|uniref:abscisic acid and environmental stress-inducible protein TAS14-like n=1 Tax=Lycium ferocissimum TaxID=112874 RepID=UPI002814D038|nr:abscisic acid and environmental stress-inducible protein TAS14-like [Lycium ferocissimum]